MTMHGISMDEKTLEQIRETLMERLEHDEKVSEMEIHNDLEGEMNAPSAEIIDIAQGLEQIGRDASMQEQNHRDLLAVEKALNKLTTGHFGICEDCEREIPARRLSVLPQARLCANCQEVEERMNSRRLAGIR